VIILPAAFGLKKLHHHQLYQVNLVRSVDHLSVKRIKYTSKSSSKR